MGSIFAVVKKDLKGYFDQPTGYILLVIFAALLAGLGFRQLFIAPEASMRAIISLWLPMLLTLFVPAATMRLVSEEQRDGTLETLLTQPLRTWYVIAAKFIAGFTFVSVGIIASLGIPIALETAGDMDVGAVVLHGGAQITSQAIQFAVANDIAVHWMSGGGWYVGGVAPPAGVQRRLRQYQALQDDDLRLLLSLRLAEAKIENQLRFITRQSRTRNARDKVDKFLNAMRNQLREARCCANADALRGCEGIAARNYFSALALLLDPDEKSMAFSGRSRRPPRDGFNAALSFGYGLLYREVMAAIIAVGLDSTVGFFHAPRTAAHPLALDLMELFRTTVWDMPLVASVNRRQWSEEHLAESKKQVWLSDEGKRLAISLFEQRKQENWKHPVLEYSLSYARAMELEARLLEKEWSGEEGLFARMRLRG